MFLVVLLSLLALSEQCCQPAKFEGIFDTDIGSAAPKSVNQMTSTFSYDSEKRMYNMEGSGTYNGYPYKFRSIQNFTSKEMHTIAFGGCKKTVITYPFLERCISDTYKVRSGYIGHGTNKKDVHFYKIWIQKLGMLFKATFDDDCILIDMTIFYGNQMQVTRLSNATIGIKDESVFNLPSSCKNV